MAAARRRPEPLDDDDDDDGAPDKVGTADTWKLIITETDEIDQIAERDAEKITAKVRQILHTEADRKPPP